MKILVTGAAGYLGSVLCELLLNEGHSVVAIDDLRYRQTSPLSLINKPLYAFHHLDCFSDRIEELIPGCDFVVPLAAVVGAPACDRHETEAWRVNAHAVRYLAALATTRGFGLITPNTNSGYGTTGAAACDETTPLNPVSRYGATKKVAEESTLEANGVVFRFATLFGVSPRMRLDLLVNDFTFRAVRDKTLVLYEPHFRRNYLHVRDGARAILHAMTNYDLMRGQAYNAGMPDANLTKAQLALKIKEHVPDLTIMESAAGSDPDKRDYLVDNTKLLATGWRPKYTLDQGVEEVIKAYPILASSLWTNA